MFVVVQYKIVINLNKKIILAAKNAIIVTFVFVLVWNHAIVLASISELYIYIGK